MAPNEVVPGPISEVVIGNVRELRKQSGLSLVALADKLAELGHPIRSTGLQRLETGKRRIEPDDVFALALAFDVSPIRLLMPFVDHGQVRLTSTVTAEAGDAWDWLRAFRPLDPDTVEPATFQDRTLPQGQRGELTAIAMRKFTEDHPELMAQFLVSYLERQKTNRGER